MKKTGKEKIILGIDPGTNITGYGIISTGDSGPSLVTLGVIELSGFRNHFLKIKHIFERTVGLIEEYHPDELAIESPFYGKNVQSMLKLGRAQGAAISAALSRSVPVFEYAPRKIKMSITGQGAASKEQVAFMLMNILKFREEKIILDATDGLAAALCHYYQGAEIHGTGKSYKSWKDFISQNPARVK